MMQYALLIYRQYGDTAALSEQEEMALTQEYMVLRAEPGVVGGAGLHPVETATTVRLDGAKPLVTDGPFADTKEYFAGFYLVDVPDLDAATEVAARIPALRFGGSVEIRPTLVPPGQSS
jgi:hypothetical protein